MELLFCQDYISNHRLKDSSFKFYHTTFGSPLETWKCVRSPSAVQSSSLLIRNKKKKKNPHTQIHKNKKTKPTSKLWLSFETHYSGGLSRPRAKQLSFSYYPSQPNTILKFAFPSKDNFRNQEINMQLWPYLEDLPAPQTPLHFK